MWTATAKSPHGWVSQKSLKPASMPHSPPPSACAAHREENAVLEQRRRDKEQTYLLSIGADHWKAAGLKPVLSYKHRRVSGNTDWLYSYKQNEIGLSLVKSF